MARPSQKLDQLLDQLETTDAVSERDRDLLLEFSEELYVRRYADATHYKHLQRAAIMAGHSQEIDESELPDRDLATVLEDRDAARAFVSWINQRYDNEESNAGYRKTLRAFGKHVTDGDEVPEPLDWVPSGTSVSYQPEPDPSDILTWEDVQTIIDEGTLNDRDAALVAVGWDAGPRGGEMMSLSVGDISDHRHGKRITVDGKRGQRTITLIPSVPYLNRWLADHPAPDDGDAPLWSKLTAAESVTHESLWKALKRSGERAGIDKPVNFTNLRRSSASHLASQGMNQAHLEDHHGWSRGSDIASRYVAIFGEQADNELARIHGRDVEADEPDPTAPIECFRCGRETPRDRDFCMWCDQALEHEAVAQLEADEQKVKRYLLGLAKDNPELLNDAQAREAILNKLAADTDLMQRAQDFVDEMG